MTTALVLMAVQGTLGAFDTLYYHEYRARLPAGGSRTRAELWLHALRDAIYAILFGTLPFLEWRGTFALALAALLLTEIGLTLADFAVEVRAREPQGVAAGERMTHGLMAIVYGAFLAHLVPEMSAWWTLPTALAPTAPSAPPVLAWLLPAMAAGVLLSGLRDAAAALAVPGAAWPWRR